MPIDLKYWRNRLAAQEHSGSPHVGLTTAQFAEILDDIENKRETLRDIVQCRLKRGNGSICRTCWERADRGRQ